MVLVNWAARLDPRGYHCQSVKRPDVAARWDGATTTATCDNNRVWVDGESIVLYNPEHEAEEHMPLRVGDCAYLKGQAKGKPAEIVKIVDIFEDDKKDFWLGVRYFWRPEKMQLPDDLDWHERELFLQVERNKEENWTGLTELVPVAVRELDDASAIDESPPPHTFFWRRQFDPTQNELVEPPAPAATAAPPAAEGTAAEPAAEGTAAEPEKPKKQPRRNEVKERISELDSRLGILEKTCEAFPVLLQQITDQSVRLDKLEREMGLAQPATAERDVRVSLLGGLSYIATHLYHIRYIFIYIYILPPTYTYIFV
jgi:hypothetical protein